MGLRIRSFKLERFRNHDAFAFDEVADLNIFIGHNGIGKTNILEAIDLLTSTSSFRHARIDQLVKSGSDSASLRMNVSDDNRDLSLSLNLEPAKKRYAVNGKPKPASSIRGVLPAISFTPDDLNLAKKSSSLKRDSLDMLGSQLSSSYHVVAKDYSKAVRYKNRLLKDEAPQALIDALDETLVVCAAQLYCYRRALFEKACAHARSYYERISESNEDFSSCYVPSWARIEEGEGSELAAEAAWPLDKDEVKELLFQSLERNRQQERARKRALVGPHNDKISFFLGGRDASDFASQGQQRSIVLSWKLAEVEMVQSTLGEKPVLLLDDVMSELDDNRRHMLVEAVGQDMQTFITATDLSPFDARLLERATIVDLGRAR